MYIYKFNLYHWLKVGVDVANRSDDRMPYFMILNVTFPSSKSEFETSFKYRD